MPNPFSSKANQDPQPPQSVVVDIENSQLTCMYCFHESSTGQYYPGSNKLIWACEQCKQVNTVKDIEIE